MFAAGNSVAPSGTANYIEDVFSTYLYTGNSTAQTITNGIDLAGNGGMVWVKSRSATYNNNVFDSTRGNGQYLLETNSTSPQGTNTFNVTSFDSNGFSLGTGNQVNASSATYASWTFREQTKFFDVVTYTGNGVAGRTVAHNLGSTPGSMIIKRTDGVTNWHVYHRSLGAAGEIYLNLTDAVSNNPLIFNNTSPTSTEFTLGGGDGVNGNGFTYVAYLFAHNAGGFGLTGADNVVSCGSGTVGTEVNLGYEPQFVIMKRTTSTGQWYIIDNMRGWIVSGNDVYLSSATSAVEAAGEYGYPTATGFYPAGIGSAGDPFIYIAIRRGPMKIPTLGTSVFVPFASMGGGGGGTATNPSFQTNFPVDLAMSALKSGSVGNTITMDRLRGSSPQIVTSATSAEAANSSWKFDSNIGFYIGVAANSDRLGWMFRRAPGFFDEVCYTGNSTARTISHNLAAVPELMIVKDRTTAGYPWIVYQTNVGVSGRLFLNTTDATSSAGSTWENTAPTYTNFSVGNVNQVNSLGDNYVAYLFATCGGVSKVGSYTGTGGLQTINCGFSSGARFVLIKRTDSTGGWYVWDSARGLSSGTDPYLLLNSTAAEITGTNYVDTDTTGFQVTASAPADINAVGGTYIFLAIA